MFVQVESRVEWRRGVDFVGDPPTKVVARQCMDRRVV